MSRIAEKKQQKRESLMNSAYELFTTTGFSKTTIRDIAHKAGVAKGTFYLYFEDKDDIRDELIRSHASELLIGACNSMDKQLAESPNQMDITDKFIFIIDYIIESVAKDRALLLLLGKNLSLGMFIKNEHKLLPIADRIEDQIELADQIVDQISDHIEDRIHPSDGEGTPNSDEKNSKSKILHFDTYIRELVAADGTKLRDTKLLFFTLIDLINSTCYDVLMYEKPVSIEEYKPYLNRCIRALVSDAIVAE